MHSKTTFVALSSALCTLLVALVLVMAKLTADELSITASGRVQPYSAPLNCPAPARDIVPNVFTVILMPGYTIKQHAAFIFQSINENIQLYIDYQYFFGSSDCSMYTGKGIDSTLLDTIRSDPGVKSVDCSWRIHWKRDYAPLRNCPNMPPKPASYNGDYLIYLEGNYSSEAHAKRLLSLKYKSDIYPHVFDTMSLPESPDKIVYLAKEVDDDVLSDIRGDSRVEDVLCDGGFRRSGLSFHDEFPDREHMKVTFNAYSRKFEMETWETVDDWTRG